MSYEERKFLDWNKATELTFQQALAHMDKTMDDLLKLVADPQEKSRGKVIVYRFDGKDSEHALLLKLVQLISNLRAGRLLIDHGFTYEWAVTRRLLYETVEDVMFLLAEEGSESPSMLHEKFLSAFYAEDLDDQGRLPKKGVAPVPRPKIEEFIDRLEKKTDATKMRSGNSLNDVMRGIYLFGSGYVHGRASSIMRLYDEKKNEFRTNGVDDEEHLQNELKSYWQIVFVSILCFAAVRGQWWGEKYRDDALQFAEHFLDVSGLQK